MKRMIRVWTLSLLALLAVTGNEIVPSTPLLQEPQASPAVLKVCWGCTYGSIQGALDAARPGDIIEVEAIPLPLLSLPYYWEKALVISKPITIRATKRFADLPDPALAGEYANITAESGQVLIEGFVFLNTGLWWYSKADLILRRNRFIDTNPYTTAEVRLRGKGQAQLIDNEIIDSFVSVFEAAQILLTFNRFIRSDINVHSSIQVTLEHNFIEGAGVSIGGPGDYYLEGNIFIGGLSLAAKESSIGLEIQGSEVQTNPTIVTANRNIIARYGKGIAIGGSLCEVGQGEWLQLSGQENVIEQNNQDLCPPDYPWPPGFRK